MVDRYDNPRWPALPKPDETPPRPAHQLVRVGPTALACPRCGALVAQELASVHEGWHARLEPPQREFRVVHGTPTPRDDRVPYRLVSFASALRPAEALHALRTWVAGQGADLSVRHPEGFRATVYASQQQRFQLTAPSVGLAVEVRPDDAGSRVTALLVPSLFGTLTGLGEHDARYLARYDELETGLRGVAERR